MLDFVSEDGRKGIFAAHQLQQAFANEHVAARQGEGIHEVWRREVVEGPGQLASSMGRDAHADLLQVRLRRGVRVAGTQRCGGFPRQRIAECDLLRIRHAVELHGGAGQLVLDVGRGREQRLRTRPGANVLALDGDDGEGSSDHNEGRGRKRSYAGS